MSMQELKRNGFVRNQWYATALAREISRKPAQFWLLDEPVVLYRKQDHEAVAMRDMCPHRHAPLSLGIVIGDEIQCPYHGLQFDCTGRCTKIPGQEAIPNALRVDVLPCVEHIGIIWVWAGDPGKADKALLPDFPWTETAGFVSVHFSGHYDAPWAMLLDNLMDMTHVPFVHGALLGAGNAVHEDPMRTWEEGGRVHYRRDVERSNFGGSAGSALASKEADEGVYVEFSGVYTPPSIVVTQIIPRRKSDDEIELSMPMARVLHCLTPRTSQSVGHLAVRSMNIAGRPHEIAAVENLMKITQGEDKRIIEAQYRNRLAALQEKREALIKADQAAVQARRAYDRLLDEEARAKAATETVAHAS
jgi:phenylpropionate dioxygenase-like ring-hydroxylating dioxygenase large terminal subunit